MGQTGVSTQWDIFSREMKEGLSEKTVLEHSLQEVSHIHNWRKSLFPTEEIVCAQVLRQGPVWHVGGAARQQRGWSSVRREREAGAELGRSSVYSRGKARQQGI